MKKNTQTVASLKRKHKAVKNSLENLREKIAKNMISDEVLEEAKEVIEEKEAEIDYVEARIKEYEAADENKDEEMQKIIDELKDEVIEIKNSLKGPKGIVATKNFLDSKEGMKAFMETVQNSTDAKSFRKNWEGALTKNGIVPADVMLPPAIIQEINDAWEDTAENFLSLLDVTGLVAYKVLSEDSDGGLDTLETSRAKGHKKGDQKPEQILNFTPKEIRAQFVYKYITIDRETVEYEDYTGALMRYIARELAYRVMHEIMRAVLIGDGRAAGSVGKIDKFEAIVDATAYYQTTTTSAAAVPTIDEVVEAVASIDAPGDIVLFMSKQTANSMRRFVAATGGTPQYRSLSDLAGELGVTEIRTTRLLDSADAGAPTVIAFVGKAYKVVGDLTMRGFENFILSYNKNEYLTEVYAGGALGVAKSAAVIVAP